ncbi:hypothetical protein AB832_00010 [Flavobacteriaceae bacterium (ex Bugula neritina AB1)]|nr:hypothetical protein AB832_00010 [Flavobacteriaceae bacterium (ex Bugula neritina AB1)]
MLLKEVFIPLSNLYTKNKDHSISLWQDIVCTYAKKHRYYHNLLHLENVYQKLTQVKTSINDWDMVLFSLFYHDYVYDVLRNDNENKSAEKAEEILKSLQVDPLRIQHCKSIILATKGHQISTNSDTNYFTDADLSILGSSWDEYEVYFRNVRKEYRYYPNFMYIKGRTKVLHHFINMPTIFKTDFFYSNFETQAKRNLQKEFDLLTI